MRAPEFWRHGGVVPALLAPAAAGWTLAGRLRRAVVRPWRAPVSMICVGNLVAGGQGKTPVAIALARRLAAAGRAPHFVTRGYGGAEAGPLRIDPARHGAREVGDEALLLARVAPAWVARERAAGARAAHAAGAGAIVLDDGLQNPSLAHDLALVVVDGGYGFGNCRVIPAGPLREPLADGLGRADAVVLVGDDRTGVASALEGCDRPVLRARLAPTGGAAEIAGRAVVAFAGIGRPDKFFETLSELDCRLVAGMPFPDHHPYAADEIMRLVDVAHREDALLVTTAKDAVRLPPEARGMVQVLEVEIEWDAPERIDALLERALATVAHG